MDDPALSADPVFSYASEEVGALSRRVIRVIEMLSGQPRIRRLYEEYRRRHRPPALFWEDALDALKLTLRLNRPAAEAIPAEGPLVVIANHPFGVIDGIILCALVARRRSDFQIMTHRVLHQAPEIRDHIIPVDFRGTRVALENNVRGRRQARDLLAAGGALIVFPSGGVALSDGMFGAAVDLDWKTLTAGLVLGSGADVLPIFFHGQNSRLYQIAGNILQTLKLSLLFHEVANKVDSTIDLTIGDIIPNCRLQEIGDRQAVTDLLKASTHALAQMPRSGGAALPVETPGAAAGRRQI
jgi:putative hemolysin